MTVPRRLPPLMAMLLVILLGGLAVFAAARFAVLQPTLGWPMTVDGDDVVIAESGPVRTRVLSLEPAGGAGQRLALQPSDLAEDPDIFDSYPALGDFYGRQAQLAGMMRAGPVTVRLQDDGGEVRDVSISPRPRGLAALPFAFWQQLAVGGAALLIAAWIWSLRPTDLAGCLFGLTGLCMAGFTFPAAIYSTRELALDAGVFRALSILNSVGASGFGAAMIALFLVYPRRLVRGPVLLVLPLVAYAWLACGIFRLLPSPDLGGPTITSVEMLGILVAIGVQWWSTRRDPRARAALRWLGLAVGVGAGAFITLSVAPKLLDTPPVLSQGVGFVFFLLIYAGVALGLRRYRLFELNDWAFGILFFIGGLMLLVGLDALLVYAFSFAPVWSLGLALMATTLVYLPVRELLWRRVVLRETPAGDQLFGVAVSVALAPDAAARSARWQALVRDIYDPLELAPAPDEPDIAVPQVREDGLELLLPALADTPVLRLRFPWRGRRLIGPAQLRLAATLADVMRKVEASRDAYGKGVLEERRRIAQDLHDDVGARLLTAMHKPDLDETRRVVREAVGDIRTIVSGMAGRSMPLADLLADLRFEAHERLDGAGMRLRWDETAFGAQDDAMLDYRIARNLIATHREILSNVIRHARATAVEITVRPQGDAVELVFADDGIGMPDPAPAGNGLANMVSRMQDIGGRVLRLPAAVGTVFGVLVPLRVKEQAPS